MKEIKIEPIGKPRMVRSDTWAKRKCVCNYWAYKDELRLKLPRYKVPESLDIHFTLSMPKSWSKKKRKQMLGFPHQQKPDIDNLVKAFLDCMADDDSYVYEIHAMKYWGESGSITVGN